MEQSSFAIGDAARTVDSAANQMKFLEVNIKELTQQAGEAMLPTFTTVVSLLVDLTTGAEDGAGAFTFLARAVAFPVQAFFRMAEAINRWVVIPILSAQQKLLSFIATLVKFGRFVGIDVTAKIEDLNLKIMQLDDQMQNAENAADGWVAAQADLTDKINQFTVRAKQAKIDAAGLAGALEDGGTSATRLAARAAVVNAQLEELNKKLKT